MLKDLRRHIMMQQVGGGLPSEYEELLYLQCKGASEADAFEIHGNFSGPLYLSGRSQFIRATNYSNHVYFRNSSWDRFMLIQNAYYVFNISGRQTAFTGPPPLTIYYNGDVVYEIWKDNGNTQFNANGLDGRIGTYDVSGDIYLDILGFCWNTTGWVYAQKVGTYSGGADIMDLIPCRNINTNEIGLYDLVNQQFHKVPTNKWEGVGF